MIAGLAGVIAGAWAYLVPASLDMYGAMDGPAGWMMEATWDGRYFVLLFAMWAAMMVAMMLPSALPTLLMFHHVAQNDPGVDSPARRTLGRSRAGTCSRGRRSARPSRCCSGHSRRPRCSRR